MVNGSPNQQIVLSGNFNASGNSRLAVDAFLGGPGSTADRLSVGGNVTGLTQVIVNDTNPGPGASNYKGIAIVNINGTGGLSNFQLSPASSHFNPIFGGVLDKGLLFYYLDNDPNRTSTGCEFNHCVALFTAPNPITTGPPSKLDTIATTIFYETALAWDDHQTEFRDWYARRPLGNIGGAGA